MATIKFYRGSDKNFNATTHVDGVYFATDKGRIYLNDMVYGLTDDQTTSLSNLANSKMISSVEALKDSQKIIFNWVGGEKTEIDLVDVIGVASDSKNGLMSASDKQSLDSLNTAFAGYIDADGKAKVATTTQAGFMTADQVILLQSLDGTGSGEGTDAGILTRMAQAEGNITTLQGQVGEWSASQETITEAIGGIEEDITKINEDITGINTRLEGLTGAMHFIGSREEVPEYENGAWSDSQSYNAGDVIFKGNKEYVCTADNVFIEFGDNGDLATSGQVNALTERVVALENTDKTHAEDIAGLKAADEAINGSISTLSGKVDTNTGNIKANTDAIAVLNGEADKDGSVAKAAADAQAGAQAYADGLLQWNEVNDPVQG